MLSNSISSFQHLTISCFMAMLNRHFNFILSLSCNYQTLSMQKKHPAPPFAAPVTSCLMKQYQFQPYRILQVLKNFCIFNFKMLGSASPLTDRLDNIQVQSFLISRSFFRDHFRVFSTFIYGTSSKQMYYYFCLFGLFALSLREWFGNRDSTHDSCHYCLYILY